MPLHEYINNPIAQDIIHNGATLQVVHSPVALGKSLMLLHF